MQVNWSHAELKIWKSRDSSHVTSQASKVRTQACSCQSMSAHVDMTATVVRKTILVAWETAIGCTGIEIMLRDVIGGSSDE